MSDEGNSREESDSAKQRRQNLINNPHITTWFFNKQFNSFFQDMLIQQWDLEDYWYCFKWQHKGSVYIHRIGKIKKTPVIN